MDIPILYEDPSLLVINKPPGIVVNNAQSVKGETVQDWVTVYLSFPRMRESALDEDPKKDFLDRAGIVHRIDKETSGILLIAKTPVAFYELQRQFKEHVIQKTYIAIVHGHLVPQEGEINAPVDRLPWNRERFGIVPGGKESVTKYRVIRVIPDLIGNLRSKTNTDSRLRGNDNAGTVVELYPQSGRTHQIRVHMKYINHAILGDYLYAGRKTARADRLWAPRVMLHAWKLTCIHPQSGEVIAFEAPIPDDMNSIIHGHT